MNVLSLFAGIGGLDLGLERAGMTVVGQVELDSFCRRVLARHWPEVPRHDDVRTAAAWWRAVPRPRVDLIAGGFPCQPISLAGLRRGDADERWMWPAMWDVIRALRPRHVLLENVTGLLAGWIGLVLADLAEGGYDAQWDCVPAAHLGAPHRRDRVWVIAADADGQRLRVQSVDEFGIGGTSVVGDDGPPQPVADSGDVGDPEGERRGAWRSRRPSRSGDDRSDIEATDLADPKGQRRHLRRGRNDAPAQRSEGNHQPARRGEAAADAHGPGREPWEGLGRPWPAPVRDRWWTPEPRVGGTADGPAGGLDRGRVAPWERGVARLATGVPHQTERLRGLGNAVVPQVAEHVGRVLLETAR